MSEQKIFYRYDGYENIKVDQYVSIKDTPCGHWIIPSSELSFWKYMQGKEGNTSFKDMVPKPRLIYPGSRKSYAYPTKEQALESFIIRKQWQIGHLKRQLNDAQMALDQVNQGLVDEKSDYYISDAMDNLTLELGT